MVTPPSLSSFVPHKSSRRPRTFAVVVGTMLVATACGDKNYYPAPAPAPVTPPENPIRAIGAYDALPGIQIVVTEITGATSDDGTFRAGDTLTIRYTAKTTAGENLNVADLDAGSIYVSGPTFNYQRVIAEQTNLRSASIYEGSGVWSYAFPVPLPQTYLAPLNDTASFTDGELTGQSLLGGTYSVGLELSAAYEDVHGRSFTDAGNTVGDFLFGGAATITPREVSKADNCNVCHTELRAHDNRREDVRTCVLCHTAGSEDNNDGGLTPGVTVEFKVMMHRLHNGSHQPSVLGMSTNSSGARVHGGTPAKVEYANEHGEIVDFSAANFPVWPNLNIAMPRDRGYSSLSSTDPDLGGPLLSPRGSEDRTRTGATDCTKCHGDPDDTGPLTAPAQGQLAYTQPTRRACGACHDDVDWTKPYVANGFTMDPQPDDSDCTDCHEDTAANQSDDDLKPFSVREAHVHPLVDPAIDPGVNTVITGITGGTGPGSKFQNGDTPTVTFTLRNDAGADIGLSTMDSCSAFFFGPTTNQQLVMPYPSPNGMSLNPFDFGGRLQSANTTGKGSMSKVFQGAGAVPEILVVQFTNATEFTVTRVDPATGAVTGSLGNGTLPLAAGSANSFPSNASLSALELGDSLTTGTFQLTFSIPSGGSTVTRFDISGAVSGSGELSASTNSSTRFSSPDLSFNLTVGGTAFTTSSTINVGIFRSGPYRFAIVGGRTVFASGDRFYHEIVPDAATYTVKMPVDLVYERLVDTGVGGIAASTQLASPAANLPVYYGRQQLWEAEASATVTTTTTGALAALDRTVPITGSTGWANGDVVVVDPDNVDPTQREYVQVAPFKDTGVINTAASTDPTVRFYFKTPLRYAHSGGVAIKKVTLTFKQEGVDYTLAPATGFITSGAAGFAADRALVMSYRSDARFGYRRHPGDALQTKYVPPANDSTDLAQERGDWQGLAYLDGTYTADMWLYKNIELGLQGELQTYRSTSNAGTIDFLYGSATTIEPKAIISASANCYTCHNDVVFHGGGRRGVEACMTCHSLAGAEDKPRWDTPKVGQTAVDTNLSVGVTIDFREMLHKIHKGRELAKAATYTVVGFQGSPSTYGEVAFPAHPGGTAQCVRCHGNDAWKEPAPRVHPSATSLVQTWTVVCSSCHDSDAAGAHFAANTSSFGVESCEVCHGPGRDYSVERVHLPR